MKIATFNLTNLYLTKKTSFCSAEDNSLDKIYQHKMNLLPTRIQAEVKKTLYKHKKEEIEELPTLRQLHLDIYSNLKKCKTLEEAQELYPEFREVLNANDIIKHKSINVKKIEQKIASEHTRIHHLF